MFGELKETISKALQVLEGIGGSPEALTEQRRALTTLLMIASGLCSEIERSPVPNSIFDASLHADISPENTPTGKRYVLTIIGGGEVSGAMAIDGEYLEVRLIAYYETAEAATSAFKNLTL